MKHRSKFTTVFLFPVSPRFIPILSSFLFSALFSFLFPLFFLTGCSDTRPSLYVHDRHGESYIPVKLWAEENPGLVLILLDYHHDTGPGPALNDKIPPASFNWVGAMISEHLIDTVLWVSGNELELPNINARKAWLERKISRDPPEIAQMKRDAVHILTWEDLPRAVAESRESQKQKRPMAVTIDLDILTIDPGTDPDKFLKEILETSVALKPVGITLALSAAYQPEPEQAWKWLTQSYAFLAEECSTPVWAAGTWESAAESLEEKTSWAAWRNTPVFIDFGKTFAPGAELWNHAPASFWDNLLETIPTGSDETGRYLSNLLNTTKQNLTDLSEIFPEPRFQAIKESARETVQQTWYGTACGESSGREPPLPVSQVSDSSYGLAIRYIRKTEDRGCFALYQGLECPEDAAGYISREAGFTDPRYSAISAAEAEELDIEISIFADFEMVTDPFDFVPGIHSLVAEYDGGRTLLQAGIAAERDFSRKQFLDTLARKAGLENLDAMPDPLFSRAVTLYQRSPFLD